jgi:2,3-bisphosphoglycerate-independent phosphoglycerate mutase
MKIPFFNINNKQSIKPVVLVVMDGFGIAPPSKGNAITQANTPNYDSFIQRYPNTELIASGESVGLPANEVGNTEVGHLTLGAGRVILQDLKRINLAIEKGDFYDNRAFLQAASHIRNSKSKLHIMGLIGSGNVHSSMNHLYALLQFCKKEDIENVYLHLFTDGRDSPPRQGIDIVKQLEEHLNILKVGKIASISGRYYAMDRDRRWERTEKAYNAIVSAQAIQTFSAEDAMKSAYARGQTDEFIEPTIIADKNGPVATIDDNDAVIFFNFRIDRPKQLTMAFLLPDFESLEEFDFGYNPETNREEGTIDIGKTFQRQKVPQNLFFVTMTQYHKNLPVSAIAFGPEAVINSIPQVLSVNGLNQMHMSESEKERFVTYYFRGMYEDEFKGEATHIVASPKVATYDKKPEMSLPKLVKEFKKELGKGKYHFFVLNFANPDMVAHTGNLEASVKAIEFVDRYLKDLVDAVLERDGVVFVTADHGNAEELLSFPTSTFFITTSEGTVNTDHSNNPVPLIVIKKEFEGRVAGILKKGALSDISPTILTYMGIQVPREMTGTNLFVNNAQQKAGAPTKEIGKAEVVSAKTLKNKMENDETLN